ncbi:MAG TPA: hypothetical protein VLB68_01845 [Pyrinomonadaceae bacterium]|nr:hypothetical protein [Pyrinomonadaceae bacterium]
MRNETWEIGFSKDISLSHPFATEGEVRRSVPLAGGKTEDELTRPYFYCKTKL